MKPGENKLWVIIRTSRSLAALCSLNFLACLSFGSRRRALVKSATESAYFPRLCRTIPRRIQAFLKEGSREIALDMRVCRVCLNTPLVNFVTAIAPVHENSLDSYDNGTNNLKHMARRARNHLVQSSSAWSKRSMWCPVAALLL